MTGRKHASTSITDFSVIDGALAAMSAGELRKLIHDIMPWLDAKSHARLVNTLIDRAARNESGWTPSGPSDESVTEIVVFAEAAKRVGYADPSDVDDYLRRGSNAFLGKNYRAAFQVFRTLLVPISCGDIDLGQHEMVDEVLGVDVATCAAQYVVAMYMTTVPAHRAEGVRSAIDDVRGVGHFWEPLGELDRIAVEPLPELDDFLPRWRSLIEGSAIEERRNDWDTDEDRWLREVVQRMEGADGLAKVARSTKRADDLRAWCRAVVEARDWKAALSAYEEAAEIVTAENDWRGDFLDGAALAAQEMSRKDLPARLERAWREAPSLPRLRRWLGSGGRKAVVKKRAAEAMEACPKKAYRQRAFLHVVLGDLVPAAKLLASAPGLGWSDEEHPGNLVFPLFCRLLGGRERILAEDGGLSLGRSLDLDERGALSTDRDDPHLATPVVDEILEIAGIGTLTNTTERAVVLESMRKAAEKRIAGVTDKRRRRHYGHAASLASACVALDPNSATTAWMARIRSEYRRYPALQRELARHDG